ncbi:MAG: hypothetical protein K2I64_02500, partial [Muribaculaceae bacterium]|nr:hypothetical protein [Muribaculaceae bacterium]
IDEFSQIIEISDPALREAVLTAVRSAVSDPDSIDLSAYTDPLTVSLLKRIKTRAKAARRRAEKRAAKRAEKFKAAPDQQYLAQPADPSVPMAVDMQLNEGNMRRLLWLKQHYAETIDNVMRILTDQGAMSLGHRLAVSFNEVTSGIKAYLRPLMEMATAYFNTPKPLRPRICRIPLPPELR